MPGPARNRLFVGNAPQGIPAIKLGKFGKPHQTTIYVTEDYEVHWMRKNGFQERAVPLLDIRSVQQGVKEQLLQRHGLADRQRTSCSIHYGGGGKALDLVFTDGVDYSLWMQGLGVLMKEAASGPAAHLQEAPAPHDPMAPLPGGGEGPGSALARGSSSLDSLSLMEYSDAEAPRDGEAGLPGDLAVLAEPPSGPAQLAQRVGSLTDMSRRSSSQQHSLRGERGGNTFDGLCGFLSEVDGSSADSTQFSRSQGTMADPASAGQANWKRPSASDRWARVRDSMPLPRPSLQPLRPARPGDALMWGGGRSEAPVAAPAAALGNAGQAPELQSSSRPEMVSNTSRLDVRCLAVGASHAALVTSKGQLYTWGAGRLGQLGQGTAMDLPYPTRVPQLADTPVASMALGLGHTLVLTQAGEVLACGSNYHGELGLGTHSSREHLAPT